jgi:hypothetical protein
MEVPTQAFYSASLFSPTSIIILITLIAVLVVVCMISE